VAGPRIAPHGSWKSPVTADLIASGTVRLGQVHLDGDDVYWIESRPTEGGRNVIVRRTPDGRTADVTPAPFNARTRVHEYGGADYAVNGGVVYFSNFADQRLYRQARGEAPQPITPAGELRYADAVVDRPRSRLLCVREDHSAAGREPANTLVSLPLESEGEAITLAAGNDFYGAARLSPDGSRLAWITWNHPDMPWDATELWVAELQADGTAGRAERVAGGSGESIVQPDWSPEGVLHFISDRTGWWNLYRWRGGREEPVCAVDAEFAPPYWALGGSNYAFESPTRMVAAGTQRGLWRLARLDPATGSLEWIDTPYTAIGDLRAARGQAVFSGSSPTEPACIVRMELASGKREVLRRAMEAEIDPGYLSVPEPIEFPTEKGNTAFALFYRPRNGDYVAPAGERPPLMVRSHGGPTSATSSGFNLGIQYWTSRGFAVVDVNYGGSTGYGREYRQRLEGLWGVVDVDDCVNAARWLAKRGEVDGDRMVITGGSAGGYTTLCALTFRDVFRAGASHFGVSDLAALATDTHKLESRYLDRLIGPYPERADLYRERSPIHFAERLSCPVIFFQGLEDRVVPPDQAERMVAALREKGVPVAYVPFEGEQHGFRKAENIKAALEGEFYFYSRVLGFELADPVAPVPIANL
jgi:dipeptidyl aminopeptidase/acylaminoacyl peptidase